MKKFLFFCATIIALTAMTSCNNKCPNDGEIIIYPTYELKSDTISTDSTSNIFYCEVHLKGHSKDTLYLSFQNGNSHFVETTLIGNIDTTFRNDWYNETLPISYRTRTENDGDSVVIQYRFDVL